MQSTTEVEKTDIIYILQVSTMGVPLSFKGIHSHMYNCLIPPGQKIFITLFQKHSKMPLNVTSVGGNDKATKVIH